ncbi:MAG: tetratricopeptide repeat protein [Deltaproteobacteria bacterium]|nr:tetratricopeptide repeat protein [Deltaproteobacteria bacterium]
MSNKSIISLSGIVNAFTLHTTKAILPINLCAYYSSSAVSIGNTEYALASIVILLIIYLLSKVADRYFYPASIGRILALALIAKTIYSRLPNFGQGIYLTLFIILIGSYILSSRDLVSTWVNTESLWQNVIKKYPNTDVAYNNLGIDFAQNSQPQLSRENFLKAVELNDQYDDAAYYLALLANEQGDIQGAQRYYDKTINLNPNHVNAWINLGNI